MADIDRDDKNDEQGESDIKVTDRRLFTLDGELRQDLDAEAEKEDVPAQSSPEPPAEQPAERAAPEGPEAGFEHRSVEEPSGVDLSMLVSSLGETALLFMGQIPNPQTGQPTVDLERARFQIDMLELLKVKCRGNLTDDEERLLDRFLYELRMLYVARSGEQAPSE
jgi:hypothetical protein